MNAPYHLRFTQTRTGLRIGVAYVPRPMAVSGDQERIQCALLDPRTARRPSALARVLGWLWGKA